jgi:hypothetical protein
MHKAFGHTGQESKVDHVLNSIVYVPSVGYALAKIHARKWRDVLVPAIAHIEHSRAFVCTAQLLGIESDLLPPALFAWLVDSGVGLHIGFSDGLHLRPLCAQC